MIFGKIKEMVFSTRMIVAFYHDTIECTMILIKTPFFSFFKNYNFKIFKI